MAPDGNNRQPEISTETEAGFWQSVRSTRGFQAKCILDLRPALIFAAGHLPGSVNICPPLDPDSELETWLPSVLLPPREFPLLVVDDNPDRLARVHSELLRRERRGVAAILWPEDLPQGGKQGHLECGEGRGHLWRPDPWLWRHREMLPPPVAGPALDLACGSGRVAVWMAMRGFAATGLDHLPDALELGRRLAAAHQVECRFEVADLRDLAAVPPGPWSVITIFRYLQRDLLTQVPGLLKPGGVILARTFLDRPGWDGKPAPKHRLRCGELPGYFPAPEFSVLAYEESRDTDGRPAAGIVVQRCARRIFSGQPHR